MLDQKEREIMAKAASAIRRLEAENLELRERVNGLEKSASSSKQLEKQVRAAEVVLRLVADGETDPEDAIEKFAQVCELEAEQIEKVLGRSDSEGLGRVREEGPAVDDSAEGTFVSTLLNLSGIR